MNTLPKHRQIIFGRTSGRTWNPAEADPITFHPSITRSERIYGVILAVAIGVAFAMLLAHWWSS
jgi:hypothetical protein